MKLKKSIYYFFIILIMISPLLACPNQKDEKPAPLPVKESTKLSFTLGWGVVLTNYIRMRLEPKTEAPEVTALGRGSIVRVIDKTKKETIKNVSSFWYQIDDGKNRGWLFGSHLAFFLDKEEAEKYQRKLKEKPVE